MLVWNVEMKALIVTLLYLAFFCGFIFTQNDVRKPPSITRGPYTKEFFRENQEVTLTCRAEGIPPVTYAWKRNGEELNFNLSNIRRGSEGDITIVNATQRDDGFYQCFATNQYGTALSTVAHIQMAFLDRSSQNNIVNMTVQEGHPFVILAARRRSFPTPTHNWEITTSDVDPRPRLFQQSQRVQSACNGDLYVAYALKEDELGGSIYKSTVFNAVTDQRSGGIYTRVMVAEGSGPPPDFPLNITYFSQSQEVALIGGSIELKCFFSGKPLPDITWSGPRNRLPSGRHSFSVFKTHLLISNISKSDEGDYICTAKNAKGTANHTLNISVEAAPIFRLSSEGLRNVDATEGESVTFNCLTFAIPNATVVWLRNGQPMDVNRAPKRFVFSNDKKSLTIRDVCQDCVEGERTTDLMVIQCNASNVHGYAFASGYLNVLLRTKVTLLSSSTFVSVDLTKEKRFQFTCSATSDPSTPSTVRWYKVGDKGQELVYSEPPYVYVVNGNLTIYTEANCSATCERYFGEYMCVGENGYSRDTAMVILNAIASKFIQESDGPRNVNVTEGDSVTFNCLAFTKPEATVAWFHNGQPINVNSAPNRFTFSNNNKSLTIREVCRNCTDRETQSDLTIIQCIASNVHRYIFASGYLNVLMKTKATISGSKSASVDFLEEKQFVYQCYATSDPSTPPTVRWYKTEPFGDLVRDEPPYVYVAKEFLIILINPKCSVECAKYLGEYRCVGDNGYSRDNQTITLSYQYIPSDGKNAETCLAWKVILGAIVLVLVLIGAFLGFRSKRRYAINRRRKNRTLPNPPSMYERVDYESAGIPLEGIGNNGRSMRRACSMYEQIGYDSIDQVLEEIRNREGATPHPPNVHRFINCEEINTPQAEALNRGRPMLDEDIKYDDLKYTIPKEEVVNRTKIDENQVHGYESLRRDSKKFSNSEVNPYLDLCSAEVNPYLDMDKKEVNSNLDMGKKEENPYLDMGKKEVNFLLDKGKKEVNFLLEKGKKEVNPYLDMGQKDVNPYLDMGKKEVNPYLDVGQKEVNPNLDMGKKEMDPNVYMTADQIRPPAAPALREADYLVLKN